MIVIKVHDKAWFEANCVEVSSFFSVKCYIPKKWEEYDVNSIATVMRGEMERYIVGKKLVVHDAIKNAEMDDFKYQAVESRYYIPLWAVEWVKEMK